MEYKWIRVSDESRDLTYILPDEPTPFEGSKTMSDPFFGRYWQQRKDNQTVFACSKALLS